MDTRFRSHFQGNRSSFVLVRQLPGTEGDHRMQGARKRMARFESEQCGPAHDHVPPEWPSTRLTRTLIHAVMMLPPGSTSVPLCAANAAAWERRSNSRRNAWNAPLWSLPLASALLAGPETQMGPVRVRTPSPRRVSAFCVVVACLCLSVCVVSLCCVCCVCALCVGCVSVSCVSRVGVVCLHVRKGHRVVHRNRIIAGLRAPPRAGPPRQERKVSVREVCDRQRVVGWSIRPPNRDSSHPTAKPGGGQGVLQGSTAA